MNSVQGFCIIAAAVTLIASAGWPAKVPLWVPLGLLVIAVALDKFAAK